MRGNSHSRSSGISSSFSSCSGISSSFSSCSGISSSFSSCSGSRGEVLDDMMWSEHIDSQYQE